MKPVAIFSAQGNHGRQIFEKGSRKEMFSWTFLDLPQVDLMRITVE